jgi:hypothetical protein
MQKLKTNTATRVSIGPFIAPDGITPVVSLTATNEKLTMVVDSAGVPTLVLDANATASGGNNDLVHVTGDDAGYFDLELTAANTNYVGRARLSINYATDHCPVFHEFEIVTAAAWDREFGDLAAWNLATLGAACPVDGSGVADYSAWFMLLALTRYARSGTNGETLSVKAPDGTALGTITFTVSASVPPVLTAGQAV